MTYEDESTLDLFRGRGTCAHCLSDVSRLEPHHLRCRGTGGGSRLDIAINLVSLCGALSGGKDCHARHHNEYDPSYNELAAIVARRERCVQGEIRLVVDALLRMPKNPPFEVLEFHVAELREITVSSARLLKRCYKEMGLEHWRKVR